MKRAGGAVLVVLCLLAVGLATGRTQAEVIEEIVAWVNGDIITKSDVEREEQMLLAEIYRRFTGSELDAQVRKTRAEFLDRMIDRKILVQRASHLYDIGKMRNALLDSFKEQQKVRTDEELGRLLAQEGMTIDELKDRLVEMYAPEEIIRFEVIGRMSVSDKEVADYYDTHAEEWEVPAQSTLREIVLLAEAADRERRRAEIEAIRERAVLPGTDFGSLAGEVSEAGTKSAGGLLGPVNRGDLAPEIDEAAFRVPVGEVSAVIEMPHGFHLIKVDARSDARRKPLDEVKEKVRADLEQDKYARVLEEYLKKARAESEIVVADAYKSRLTPTAPRSEDVEKNEQGK